MWNSNMQFYSYTFTCVWKVRERAWRCEYNKAVDDA